MSYYANTDLAAYAALRANYDNAYAVWHAASVAEQQRYDDAYAEYEAAHDYWANNTPNDDSLPFVTEPQPPEPPVVPPEPIPPAPPPTVYEAQQVQQVTTIDTPTGPALIVPGRYVMTGNGASFAISEGELNASYTDTSEALPV